MHDHIIKCRYCAADTGLIKDCYCSGPPITYELCVFCKEQREQDRQEAMR